MNWTFQHITPNALENENLENSQLWNKEIEFLTKNNYAVVSDSGKGKTTFINYCYGLRNDYKGKLLLENKSIDELNFNTWAHIRSTKLAYIPQNLQLLKEHTIWENLIVKNDLTNFKSEEEILRLLSTFGIEKIKDKKAKETSLGQQQRTAIIRALIQPFETLLMDEPFSHLDNNNSIIAAEEIYKTCKEQNANFIVTSLTDQSPFKDVVNIKI